MTSTVAFPSVSTPSVRTSATSMSLLSIHATAVEISHSVYGDKPSSADAIERFYEPHAANFTQCKDKCLLNLAMNSYTRYSYENPFVTATSRSIIEDIYTLSERLGNLTVPRPLAMLLTILRLSESNAGILLRATRSWTDIGDLCESESFDGTRKIIIEHTFNLLLLPGIHRDGPHAVRLHTSSDLISPSEVTHSRGPSLQHPSLPVPGTSLAVPSPLHLKLPIITRLTFNEQGRITHHRDYWDVKDLLGLVPGVSLTQWVSSRLAAQGLALAARMLSRGTSPASARTVDLESGPSEPGPDKPVKR
ncbi:uncharacterized protein SCHCODRAFT_02666689 [Schizophyllum commune H4-8]|uniref:Uncharacterized protein n=1 Tax=Schizophyllum commune (strain H4-8 / FGSC 9210) TaxID=578458 RepID=D8PQF9_SCHCM|nr:uncharacterized protein SCHCODRAFT_02666689 [Schizophyllum commune H4-8]KAI5893597.1 hypothetical protein SCHCODRAFT_02666689 [Schizophyllum commune H4-8]